MSKQVRWQVPFAAHDGTRYRVDIYDEGYTGNPVVLTAGDAGNGFENINFSRDLGGIIRTVCAQKQEENNG